MTDCHDHVKANQRIILVEEKLITLRIEQIENQNSFPFLTMTKQSKHRNPLSAIIWLNC